MTTKMTQTTVTGRYVGGSLFEVNDDNKFSALVVLDDGQEAKIEKIRDLAIKEKFGDKKPAGLVDWCLREGDDPEYTASFGHMFINPKGGERNPPKTVMKVNGVLTSVGPETIYPGCFVAISVNAYALPANTEKKMKACVCLGLGNVMFLRDGERLGGTSNPDDDFAEFESDVDDLSDLLGEVA